MLATTYVHYVMLPACTVLLGIPGIIVSYSVYSNGMLPRALLSVITVVLVEDQNCTPPPTSKSLSVKCLHTDDELADHSSFTTTGYFSDLMLFCTCASGTNDSNNETKFEYRWTNNFIRIFDLFVSPLVLSHATQTIRLYPMYFTFFFPTSCFLCKIRPTPRT